MTDRPGRERSAARAVGSRSRTRLRLPGRDRAPRRASPCGSRRARPSRSSAPAAPASRRRAAARPLPRPRPRRRAHRRSRRARRDARVAARERLDPAPGDARLRGDDRREHRLRPAGGDDEEIEAPPAGRGRTSSSQRCRRDTRPTSASAGGGSPAASASGSRSPARCSPTRPCSSSTSRPPVSTPPRARSCSPASRLISDGRRSSSRTTCSRSATPTGSPSSIAAGGRARTPRRAGRGGGALRALLGAARTHRRAPSVRLPMSGPRQRTRRRRPAAPGRDGSPGYEVIEHLRRGNDLDVYDAWSEERGSRCVAKALRPDRARHGARAALLREGELLARAHPSAHRPRLRDDRRTECRDHHRDARRRRSPT